MSIRYYQFAINPLILFVLIFERIIRNLPDQLSKFDYYNNDSLEVGGEETQILAIRQK